MKIISFAWTTAALLAGAKTVTRREWKREHALQFHAGELIQAYDRLPHQGGHKIAIIRLACDPYQEHYSNAPDADFAAEGLAWMQERYENALNNGEPAGQYTLDGRLTPLQFWQAQKYANAAVYVVRFELVEAL